MPKTASWRNASRDELHFLQHRDKMFMTCFCHPRLVTEVSQMEKEKKKSADFLVCHRKASIDANVSLSLNPSNLRLSSLSALQQ